MPVPDLDLPPKTTADVFRRLSAVFLLVADRIDRGCHTADEIAAFDRRGRRFLEGILAARDMRRARVQARRVASEDQR